MTRKVADVIWQSTGSWVLDILIFRISLFVAGVGSFFLTFYVSPIGQWGKELTEAWGNMLWHEIFLSIMFVVLGMIFMRISIKSTIN